MSQEGADMPHEVEHSHDHATAPDGSTPAAVGSAIVKVASSSSESVGELAGEINNAGSKPSPALLHAGEDSNTETESKIDSPVELHAGEDNTGSKLSSPVVLHAGEDNNAGSKLASPAALHDGEDNNAGSKLASPAALHDGEDKNAGSKVVSSPAVLHAGDDNTTESKLASPVVLDAGEGTNAESTMDIPMLDVIVDSNTDAEFKHDSPAVLYTDELASQILLHAGDDKLARPTVLQAGKGDNIQAVPHAGEDNNAESMLSEPGVFQAGEGTAACNLTMQAVPHADEENNAGSTLTMHPGEANGVVSDVAIQAVLQAGDGEGNNNTASKHAIQAVPVAGGENNSVSKIATEAEPYAGEDNNAGGSKIAMLTALHAGEGEKAASELDVQMVSNAGEEDKNNAGFKLASPAAAVNADDDNAETGMNNIVVEGGDNVAAAPVMGAPTAMANRGRCRGRGRGKGKAKSVATEEEKGLHIFTERERRKKMKNMFSSLHALLPRLPEKVDKATVVGEAVNYIRSLENTLKNLEKLKQDRIRAQQVAAGATCSRAAPPPPAPPAPTGPTRESVLADMVHSWNAQEDIMTELRAAASAVVSGAPRAAVGSSSSSAPAPAPALQTWSGPNIVVCIGGSDAFINLSTPRRSGTLTRLLHVLERHRISVMAATISSEQTRSFFSIQARINEATPPPPMLPGNLRVEERYKLAVGEMMHAIGN